MTPTTNHGHRLRRRQITARLLEHTSRLLDLDALWWPRGLRNALWIVAVVLWIGGQRMDAMLALLAIIAVQIVIFQLSLLAVLREDGER